MKRVCNHRICMLLLVLGLGLFLASSGCAQKQQESKESETTQPLSEEVPKSKENIKVENNKVAVIETDKGTIKFTFYPDEAPKTVENFIKLANEGFYDGTKFHRVVPGFVIQGGDPNSKDDDPTNDGKGGPGYNIDAEFSELKHVDGTVAMARSSDPNSAGSQFYICLGPQPNLDGQYTVFGQVSEGLDVVHKIEKGDVMKKVYIEEK
jgi:peptidyl-prolyl cis-trans isomerase B (cyclophilin B)